MINVFIFAGQSNSQGHGVTISLDPVPNWAKIKEYDWMGTGNCSLESNYQYSYPNSSTHPSIWYENPSTGLESTIPCNFGNYDLYNYPASTGTAAGVKGSFGLEYSFVQQFRNEHPNEVVAVLKQSLGGSSLRGDWLPYTVPLFNVASATLNTINRNSNDWINYANFIGDKISITSGPGSGQVNTIVGFSGNTIYFQNDWSTVPTTSSTYGFERKQLKILKTMINNMASYLDSVTGAGNWKWAGFIWMQGESGAHSAGTAQNDSVYLSDARALFEHIRSITRSDLPIVIGKISNQWGWETTPNIYLSEMGYPYAAIDASFTNDGRIATTEANRAAGLAGAVARRATQVTLSNDPNCTIFSSDNLPPRPPFYKAFNDFWGITSITGSVLDKYAYHHHTKGNLTLGERAYTAWKNLTNQTPPPPPVETSIVSFNLSHIEITGGKSVTGTVVFNKTTPATGFVFKCYTNSVTGTFNVPSNVGSYSFVINTVPVPSDLTVVYNVNSATGVLSKSLLIKAPILGSHVLSTNTVEGGTSLTGTVYLSDISPAGGVTVNLNSSVSNIVVPLTVIVEAGKTSANYNITTTEVTSNITGVISASLSNITIDKNLAVNKKPVSNPISIIVKFDGVTDPTKTAIVNMDINPITQVTSLIIDIKNK